MVKIRRYYFFVLRMRIIFVIFVKVYYTILKERKSSFIWKFYAKNTFILFENTVFQKITK